MNAAFANAPAAISVYTNVPLTAHVLFILSKISRDILRTCLRTFEADIPKIFKNVQPQLNNSTFLYTKKECMQKGKPVRSNVRLFNFVHDVRQKDVTRSVENEFAKENSQF